MTFTSIFRAATVPRPARYAGGLVLACFFASGLAGLVYELVWARYLALFLGHTSYAVAMAVTAATVFLMAAIATALGPERRAAKFG